MDRSSTDLAWRKSSFSTQGENCVEVAPHMGGMAVRDSKNPRSGMLAFTPGEWSAFIAGVKAGEFD